MKHKVTKKTDKLAVELFGRNASDCVLKGACVSCTAKVLVMGSFHNEDEEEEYRRTGLCPVCEDELRLKHLKTYDLEPPSTSYTQLPLKEIESLAIRRKKK